MPQDAAIIFEDVTKRFGDGRPALDHVSLAVQAREFLAVVGASGSGKTTLLQLINRLSEPSGGRLRVGGADVQSLDPIALRDRVRTLEDERERLERHAAFLEARIRGLHSRVRYVVES